MEKITPTVCGLSGRSAVAECTGEEQGRYQSTPVTAKSVGVRCCVGLRRCLCRLDGRRHLAVTVSFNDTEVGIGFVDLVRDADARLVVAGDAKAANIVERVYALWRFDGFAIPFLRSISRMYCSKTASPI